ncbi:Arc family DNA-binding protein [Xenorhabdus sp. KJ12.1]|uniref:Arc family DNA-binding protein n=1 Tax=Xenorhabdus sp. KJ12.1 TaxID=1851571 RepID=UPI000C051419|nr:Arc family DNA-binding protein [Xenorhabdus sp. KJ12.1]PHM67887.1 hypothetical protein Xekj_03802 [Xenorhabdus sp. KJ12.1]
MSKYPSQIQDKFTVRFPDGMRDEIAKIAEENGRSMNSEIIEMLKFSIGFKKDSGNTGFGIAIPTSVTRTILSRNPSEDKTTTLALLKEAALSLQKIENLLEISNSNDDEPNKKAP